MDTSYHIPREAVKPGDKMPPDALVTEAWPVKSMITSHAPNTVFKLGHSVLVEGCVWVGEDAITRVDLLFDEGVSWRRTQLNKAVDKYACR